jgi:ubiquinone/menaquinone biosynthesis C-methylase UbiE
MTQTEFIEQLITPYGPAIPVKPLVVELNKLYHRFEAKEYDSSHPEVHEQLPPIWEEMIWKATSQQSDKCWDILDFGCGTGFEATQLVEALGVSRIRSLTCYDPSPEMLAVCRSKLGSGITEIRFVATFAEVLGGPRRYDLLTTNSLLHHLPGPIDEIRSLDRVMNEGAWWLMGHEPSRRFYANPDCSAELRAYRAQYKLRKLGSPAAMFQKLRTLCGTVPDPARSTAKAAWKGGLFTRRPPASVIGRLVDYNVPHSVSEAAAGRGFDFQELASEFSASWRTEWVKSYSFMGPYPQRQLTAEWQSRCERLSSKYPLDGANFAVVWRRA